MPNSHNLNTAINQNSLTLNRLGRAHFDTTPLSQGFSKNLFSRKRVKSYLFVAVNIIIRHIFPENFIEITQVN